MSHTSRPSAPLSFAEALEGNPALDRLAAAVAKVSSTVVPPGRAHAELRGRSLGHPLHAVLTDLPLGLWTSAVVLDLTGPARHADAARRLVGLGVLSALPTVLAGLADFRALGTPARRVAATHAAVNGAGNAMFTLSYLARRAGRRRTGVALSLVGASAAGLGGFLGGHLVGRLHEPSPVPAPTT